MLKILLTALNAKYIHTCPAIWSLRAYAMAELPEAAGKVSIAIAEYTINDRYRDVLAGIMSYDADVIAFSTYIWNVDRVRRLIRDIRKICGDSVKIWAGGPEATWYPEAYLREDGADLCMLGEGEIIFTQLVQQEMNRLENVEADPGDALRHLPGLAFVQGDTLVNTGMAPVPQLDGIPFLYQDLSLFENRILYYEASRGCPFACAYCLSGRERGVRYRDLNTVKKELQFFLDEKVKQVKFVDRTFNADPQFAMEIWSYLATNDNQVTNFHFEIEADRMTDEEITLISQLRPGLIQMEIGVQSANPDTLRSVHRGIRLDRVRKIMDALVPVQNVNLHLDLIAGLPFEDYDSFRSSFCTVYAMRPHQLQLGFLKLLKGTELYDRRDEYGLVYSQDAPYEVLKTNWISYAQLEKLHRISDLVEEYVNSQGFRRSLPLVETLFPDAFSLFEALDAYYREMGYETGRPSSRQRYDILTELVLGRMEEDNVKSAHTRQEITEMIRFDRALHVHQSRRMVTEEVFDFGAGPVRYRFDHTDCSPVNGEAAFRQLS